MNILIDKQKYSHMFSLYLMIWSKQIFKSFSLFFLHESVISGMPSEHRKILVNFVERFNYAAQLTQKKKRFVVTLAQPGVFSTD